MSRQRLATLISIALLWGSAVAADVTTPKEEFGFDLGADYHLANYQQLVAYWKKLETESERLVLEQIGTTAEGRSMLMAIITSPENHKNLDRYKETARRLALAEDLSEEEARRLAREGKAVVWIDGGLHATEVLGAQQLMELVYQMVSREDEETLRFLDDVILLAVCVNPDGLDLVADWYMREPEPSKRSTRNLPRLYHKYIGHDNNRDFYMVAMPETEAINRTLFREWFPQIAYNHHQTGPAGTVLFAPPFRDPFNYNIDPLVITGLDLVGAAMHNRFVAEGKPGATMRSGASYSTWWNGGLRTTQYFHNIIGLLTETIGNPTPIEIPFILRRQLPNSDLPAPIAPQPWHFRQSVDYSITANRAVLDVASRYREHLLFNIYQMGRNSIERGSRDHWTITPKNIAAVRSALSEERDEADPAGRNRGAVDSGYFDKALRAPENRDPRGYILPSDQPDFITAGKFINTLIKNGIKIHRATADFELLGTRYPARSFVVKTAQAFRPHILDMFEPQHHPDDIPYPGGPPTPPYDSAGWTLAYQMGVVFDRILEGFDGPFVEVDGLVSPAPGQVGGPSSPAGYLLSHQANDSFIAVNRLLKQGIEAYWLKESFTDGGLVHAPGTIYIPAGDRVARVVQGLASDLGLDFHGISEVPPARVLKLKPVRIGLWDRYGGSMPSGWLRFILEQFEFPFELVFAPTLDSGNLNDRFDVLIFVAGAIPGDSQRRRFSRGPVQADSIPEEYRSRLGNVTAEKTIPKLVEFMQSGGTILTIGSSTGLAYHAGLPIRDPLTERVPDGSEQPLGREKYYVPGSVLRARVDSENPLAYGLPEWVDVYFDNSPVFDLQPEAAIEGISPVAWFDDAEPLRSGWAWGQGYLKDAVSVLSARIGSGNLFLFGPEITFRSQPHGTFKFLFNGIYLGGAEEVSIGRP